MKAGEKAYIVSGSRDRIEPATVDRVTKTQVIVGGRRFRKSDGRQVGWQGSTWNPAPRLVERSPEWVDRYDKQRTDVEMRRLRTVIADNLTSATHDQLSRAAAALLDEKQAEQ